MSTPHKTPPKFLENLHSDIKDEVNRKNFKQGSPFSCLPNHMTTPPNRLLKIKNPFEAAINEKLHLQIFSPSVFAETKSNTPDTFKWTIDDVSNLKPANIDESTISQFEQAEDDVIVQAKIEKYFSERYIVPSPWNAQANAKPLIDEEKLKDNSKEVKDESTQTMLTLPEKLPESVEKILLPYFSFKEERVSQIDMNSSLCRRLFHFDHHDDNASCSSSLVSELSEMGSADLNIKTKHSHRNFDSSEAELSSVELSPILISTPLEHCDISPIQAQNDDLRPRCSQREVRSPNVLEFSGYMSVDSSFNLVPSSPNIEAVRVPEYRETTTEQTSGLSNQSIRRNLFEVSAESMDISEISRVISPTQNDENITDL